VTNNGWKLQRKLSCNDHHSNVCHLAWD
jgi:hypothetical protein